MCRGNCEGRVEDDVEHWPERISTADKQMLEQVQIDCEAEVRESAED